MSILQDNEIPTGFAMALAQNLDALNAFSRLDENARGNVLARTRNAQSKAEMQRIVDDLL